MNIKYIKEHEHEYLGHCEQKGFIYSVKKGINTFIIVAVQGSVVTPLITHTVKENN
jgi:hypothetical protein